MLSKSVLPPRKASQEVNVHEVCETAGYVGSYAQKQSYVNGHGLNHHALCQAKTLVSRGSMPFQQSFKKSYIQIIPANLHNEKCARALCIVQSPVEDLPKTTWTLVCVLGLERKGIRLLFTKL